jgi:structural maintenance of chromosome 3 (chondroitin sulfate proteoglycan 6)
VFRSRLDDLEADAGAGVILSGEVELKKSELGNLERTIEQMQIQVEGE